MNKQYSYPLDLSWSTEELASVLSFNDVEATYEGKVEAQKLLDSYKGFKAVVPSKSEEKRLGREFETVSGYSFTEQYRLPRKKGRKDFSWKVSLNLLKSLLRRRASISLTICRKTCSVGDQVLSDRLGD